jgi:hypothetical protein
MIVEPTISSLLRQIVNCSGHDEIPTPSRLEAILLRALSKCCSALFWPILGG